MKKTFDIAWQTAVALLITFVISVTSNYFLDRANGIVNVGQAVQTPTDAYLPIQISNSTKNTFDGVIVSVASTAGLKDFFASTPLQIEELPATTGLSNSKRFRLSGVAPRKEVRILLRVPKDSSAFCNVLNAEQLKIKVSEGDSSPNPIDEAVSRGGQTTLIYGVFFLVSALAIHSRVDNANQRVNKLMETAREHELEISRLRSHLTKVRVYLFSRISDYSRELDFWRDAVRKFLYQQGEDKRSREAFLTEVSKALKTYSTRSGNADFEMFSFMTQRLMAEEEKSTKTDAS